MKNHKTYLLWKRKNVTYRGIKNNINEENGVYGSFGRGLYTAALSNKKMAAQYGKVYFVVNARPQNPKKLQYLGDAEEFYRQNNKDIKNIIEKGYDGLQITGREYVNYKPVNIIYFENEEELKEYYMEYIFDYNTF